MSRIWFWEGTVAGLNQGVLRKDMNVVLPPVRTRLDLTVKIYTQGKVACLFSPIVNVNSVADAIP